MMVNINYNDVFETAQVLCNNIGEQTIVRNQEYIEALINLLIDWNVKYDCKFEHHGEAGFCWVINTL